MQVQFINPLGRLNFADLTEEQIERLKALKDYQIVWQTHLMTTPQPLVLSSESIKQRMKSGVVRAQPKGLTV